MSRTLILMRHAKSSWDQPDQEDFDRPLNGRGRGAAETLGRWLTSHGYLPDEVVVSGARRTVETWSRMAHLFPATTTMQSDPALYMANAETLLGVIRTRAAPTVMLIAHNPGIANFALRIVAAPAAHPKYAQYPTGATSIISFDTADWAQADWGKGTLTDFVVPRELTG